MNVIPSGTAWSVGGELSINPVFNWIWLLWLVPLLFYAALFTLIAVSYTHLAKSASQTYPAQYRRWLRAARGR